MISMTMRWCSIFAIPYVCLGTAPPVLMLGDSYTAANNGLDTILSKLFESAGDKHEVKSVTSGGKDFAWHAKMLRSPGSEQEIALGSKGQQWGWVVLQDRSHVPAFCCNGPAAELYGGEAAAGFRDFGASLAAVQDLDHAAEAHGAKTVLLQTWGRRSGVPVPFLAGFEPMNELVIRGYDMYASSIAQHSRKPIIVPVGSAFGLIYDEIAESQSPREALSTDNLWTELYSSDGSHPSVAGSYLTACMLYATITNKSPVGLAGVSGVTATQVTALQRKAHDTVFTNTSSANEFKEEEGRYMSADESVKGFVADIRGGFVIWPVGIRSPLKWNGRQLEMFFHGEVYKGSVSNGVITWSDGDVWKRAEAAQDTAASPPATPRVSLARRESDVLTHTLAAH